MATPPLAGAPAAGFAQWREIGKAGAGNKPGSVEDNHSSRTAVTGRLQQPTRESARDRRCGANAAYSPIWSCSGRGLPCRGLLPAARCALTAPFHPYRTRSGGLFSVALSMGSRPPGVTWRPVRRSPDFPLPLARQRLPGRLRRFRTADSNAFGALLRPLIENIDN